MVNTKGATERPAPAASPAPTAPLFRPFAALRPAPGRAAEVAAPPYDVLTTDEARARARGKPWSFLHVSRPEIDLAPGADPGAPEVYAKAGENLRRMIAAGVLRRDPEPRYYVWRLALADHVQTGVVAAASIAAYEANRIRRHESTRPDIEEDRARQIEAVGAQTGPVMTAHRPLPEAAAVLGRIVGQPPADSFTADDGVDHTLWVVSEPASIERLTRAYAGLDVLYIADGHHRSAAAHRVASRRRAANADHRGDEAYNFFLVVAFASDELQILPYNRVVRDLNGLTKEAFLARLGGGFVVEPVPTPVHPAQPARPGEFAMYLDGAWYRLAAREAPPPEAEPLERLDVKLLYDRLLEPILGLRDPRSDPRIGFVGGIRGCAELERRVDGGEMAVAFALNPTRMADLMAVADSGRMMPPKCTWFEPKLADGMASHVLE